MIRDRNIDDTAAIQLHKILGPGQVGEIYWVATVTTQAYQYLRDRVAADRLFTTLEEAVIAAVADGQAIIFIAPNHAETVAAAAAINLNKSGLTVIGLGGGAARPTFTFSATASTITITAASIKLSNILIKPSIDSVVSPIVVSAADCTIDVEVQDASATVECVNAILTTAAADRLDIKLRYRGFIAGNACVNAIRLVGVDTARIYVDFYGVASTAIIEFHTTACHDIDIVGKFYNNGTSLTKNVVDTATLSTWSAKGWDGNSNAGFSGGDNAALAGDDVSAVAAVVAAILADTTTIGDATLPVAPVAGSLARFVASGGTALGIQLPDSKSLYDMVRQYGEGYVATKQSAISAAGTVTLFTVTGEVEVIIAGYIDVAMTGTLGLLEVGIAGATAGLIAQAAQAALLIDLLWVSATPATLVAKPTAKIIANGADIIQTAGGTVTASTVTYYCYWRPLSADGNVVAA